MRRLYTLLAALLTAAAMIAAPAGKYTGTTETDVLGKHVVQHQLVLTLDKAADCYQAQLKGFAIMGFSNISISGEIILSPQGQITGFRKAKIKGVPAKVTHLTGSLTAEGADITLRGKAGPVQFVVHYVGK